jgi:hypothetical protein
VLQVARGAAAEPEEPGMLLQVAGLMVELEETAVAEQPEGLG